MWNFDRYQRWMEQKKDWVRSDALGRGEGSGEAVTPAPAATAASAAALAPAAPTGTAARGSISIDEAMDIEELTDLARQIEKRL
jgi:hypothetical protein